ncbi:MAG TPA: MHYT domain-containing protein [Candidatus Udaeobacter sp.]|nr:MHYT domain-containing protein [Candidatus Udaeobacter sp.]
MPVTHEPWLVALSLVVAIQGAYVGLSLAVQIRGAEGLRRRLLLAGAALSLAVAIWAMHFVGMLAAKLPFPTDYLVFPTLLSFLVCVIVVGAAVFAVSAGPLTPARLAVSSVAMGIGIASMHYIGMAALHASAHLEHATVFVVASVAVGIAASGLALWLAGGRRGRPPLLLSATAFGLAIAGMHYTAMAGLTVFPHADAVASGPALSTDLLAIVVAVVAFLVSGVFLLILVPDRSSTPAAAPVSAPKIASEVLPASVSTVAAELGQGTYAPLGGAGGPPRRAARQLPVEKGGATIFLPVEEIVAVHANAHYTYVFDGKSQLFCPLSIGDVQSRLDANQFLRVHRSHIVNLDRIAGLKRAGDQGIVELAAQGSHTVPVSRNRFNWLKSQLGLRLGQAAQ